MSKAKTKAQLRKEKIRQETEMINQKNEKIKIARESLDNLADIPMFKKFNKNGLTASLTYYQRCPNEYKTWMFDLTKRNMQKLYEETWGWGDGKKRNELFDDNSRYIIFTLDPQTPEESPKPVGFVHFRFELETGTLRLYIYEFQVEPEYQGKGIGRFMMQATEFIALKRGMECVMLTVFKINEGAVAFYKKMNYALHPISPSIADPEHMDEYDYDIYYKSLVKNK